MVKGKIEKAKSVPHKAKATKATAAVVAPTKTPTSKVSPIEQFCAEHADILKGTNPEVSIKEFSQVLISAYEKHIGEYKAKVTGPNSVQDKIKAFCFENREILKTAHPSSSSADFSKILYDAFVKVRNTQKKAIPKAPIGSRRSARIANQVLVG